MSNYSNAPELWKPPGWPHCRDEWCELLKAFLLERHQEANTVYIPQDMEWWYCKYGSSSEEWPDRFGQQFQDRSLVRFLDLEIVWDAPEFALDHVPAATWPATP